MSEATCLHLSAVLGACALVTFIIGDLQITGLSIALTVVSLGMLAWPQLRADLGIGEDE